ncbi:MAG: hypothetical protein DRJ38_08610 [Thermoprotei archaeon]|nr:MAG: hypothetical protein DRJ38_08610 [Thermoprotei archaeon]
MTAVHVELGAAELEFISRIAKLSARWGLGEAVGKVLAVLFLSNKPLSQGEISKLTGYSVGQISSSLSLLESLGLVIYSKEGRRKLYKAAGLLLDVLENFLERTLKNQLSPTVKFIRENLPRFNERTRENAEKLLQEYEKARILLEMNIEYLKKWKNLSPENFAKKMRIVMQ